MDFFKFARVQPTATFLIIQFTLRNVLHARIREKDSHLGGCLLPSHFNEDNSCMSFIN